MDIADRFQGCLLGLAIGDALGMPVEMMTPNEILTTTGGRGVTGYLNPIQTRIQGTAGLKPGTVTDDTMLSFAVGWSLVDCGRFVTRDQGRTFVKAFETNTFGWGRTTRESAEEIKLWFDSAGKYGRNPEQPAPPPKKPGASCGNGVAMKIAPLALYDAIRYGWLSAEFLSETFELGLMTHGDPRASIAALAVGDAISIALNGYPRSLLATTDFCDALHWRVRVAESRYRFCRPSADLFSARLNKAFGNLGRADTLRETVGTGCFALESVPFAIATFLRHPRDFRAAVLEAVNAGGDADTTASMVGAMVGANVGLAGIPPDLAVGCLARYEAMKLGTELAEAAEKNRK